MTGPGTLPPNVHASYEIPGATWIVLCAMPRLTSTTGLGTAAGNSAGYARCAVAIASALAGARPAKLGLATAPAAPTADDIPGIVEVLGAGAGRPPPSRRRRSRRSVPCSRR